MGGAWTRSLGRRSGGASLGAPTARRSQHRATQEGGADTLGALSRRRAAGRQASRIERDQEAGGATGGRQRQAGGMAHARCHWGKSLSVFALASFVFRREGQAKLGMKTET